MITPVVEFATIDSTNSEAQRRVAAGERGPLWIRADRQLTGRGRSGRVWSSPPGNFSATYVFTPGCPLEHLHQLSFVVSLAAHDTIAHHLASAAEIAHCSLKWPNDVLIEGAKVGGILVESSVVGCEAVAMIGCGLNIAVRPPVDGRDVTALADHGACPTPAAFLAHLDRELQLWLGRWRRCEGFAVIRDAWLDRAHPIGASLVVNASGDEATGAFHGLAEDGALLLAATDGTVQRFHFGDVALGGSATAPVDREKNDN